MLLNFTTVAQAVAELNAVSDPRSVVNKIVHYQSRGFPLPRAGNRRRKPMLDATDTMRLVIACELMACGMSTARTIRLVEGSFAEISAAVVRAAKAIVATGERASEIIAFAPKALQDTMDDDGPLHELVPPGARRPAHRLVTIDIAHTVRSLAASLERLGVASRQELLLELLQTGVTAAATANQNEPANQ